jgi:WD40 repeat protein
VLPFPEGVVKTVRFSRNGRLLVAGGGSAAKSGRVVVWDVATAARVVEVGDEYDEVLAADLSPDQRLVALGGPGRVVRILATGDGRVESEIRRHTDWVTALEFSPDGTMLVTGDRAGNLFLWETRGAREGGVLRGHTGPITGVAWRGDGRAVASVSGDGSVRLWDPKAGAQVKTWQAHAGGVEGIAWLSDGRIATTGRDRRAKLWKQDGQMIREMPPLDEVIVPPPGPAAVSDSVYPGEGGGGEGGEGGVGGGAGGAPSTYSNLSGSPQHSLSAPLVVAASSAAHACAGVALGLLCR